MRFGGEEKVSSVLGGGRRKGSTHETMVAISPLRANRIATTDNRRRRLRVQKLRDDLVRNAILKGYGVGKGGR